MVNQNINWQSTQSFSFPNNAEDITREQISITQRAHD